jgi:Clp amino terminal domain, pathogenicity island component
MFERYGEKARHVIFFARYEASQYGSPHIETEHLLLGVLREDPRLLNWEPGIRGEIEAEMKIGERISTSVEVPLSQECMHILNYAAEEATKMGHPRVEPAHLLLAILREEKCLAARFLSKHAVIFGTLREKIATQMPPETETGAAGASPAVIVRQPHALSQARLGTALDDFVTTWRGRDPRKLASFFAAHGQFWDIRGELWLSPAQAEKGLAIHFDSADLMELEPDIRDVTFVTAEVAVVTLVWKPEADAKKRNAAAPRMVLVLGDARPGWLIVSAHLTLLQPNGSSKKRKH